MHRRLLPLALMSTLMAAACSAGEQAAARAVDAATPDNAPPPITAPQTPPTTPAPDAPAQPPSDTPDGDLDLAHWDGYDALKLGMDEAAFRKAWGGELNKQGPSDGATCFHFYAKSAKVPAEIAFMFEDGKFVRYSVSSTRISAPGGGKVGMTKGEIAKLYAGRIEEQPHHYTDGQYLRIKSPDGGQSVLIFETGEDKTDAAKVTEWRVGVPPQVDYVEGCS